MEGQTVIGAERAGARSETYTVHFETRAKRKVKQDSQNTDDREDYVVKKYSYKTSESKWSEYEIEHVYTLKINSFGAIMNDPLQDSQ